MRPRLPDCGRPALRFGIGGGLTLLLAFGLVPAGAQTPEEVSNPAAPEASTTSGETPAAAPSAPPKPEPPPPEIPWELRPYVVDVPVTFEVNPLLNLAERQRLINGIERRLADDLGSMWTLSIHAAEGGDLMNADRIALLTPKAAGDEWLTRAFDKVYPLFVGIEGGGYRFVTREWDHASRLLSPPQKGLSVDRRLAPGDAAAVIRSAFRSLVQVDSVDGSSVVLGIRAGELSPPDPTAAQLVQGDLVVPFYQQLNRKREIVRVQEVPWTMLRAETIERARIEATSISAYPVGVVPSKRRMVSLAIEIRPWYPETTLYVVPRNNPGNPITGARVDIVDRLPTKQDPVLDRTEYRTDRHGAVRIPGEPTPTVRYAIANSGKAILARVPFCPGAFPALTLEVVDDSPRLAVEGEVSLLEADLVELIAHRKILSLRAEAAAKAGKTDEAQGMIAQLRALPDYKTFQERIDLARTAGVQEARKARNALSENRIRKLCKGLSDVAADHLNAEKFQQMLSELDESVRSGGTPKKK